MARELTALEIESFLKRNHQIARAVRLQDTLGVSDMPVAYPDAGVAVRDTTGNYVLVWRDYSERWHYLDLSQMEQMQTISDATNAPAFVSDPDYLGLIHAALGDVGSGIEWGTIALAAVAVIVVARKL